MKTSSRFETLLPVRPAKIQSWLFSMTQVLFARTTRAACDGPLIQSLFRRSISIRQRCRLPIFSRNLTMVKFERYLTAASGRRDVGGNVRSGRRSLEWLS